MKIPTYLLVALFPLIAFAAQEESKTTKVPFSYTFNEAPDVCPGGQVNCEGDSCSGENDNFCCRFSEIAPDGKPTPKGYYKDRPSCWHTPNLQCPDPSKKIISYHLDCSGPVAQSPKAYLRYDQTWAGGCLAKSTSGTVVLSGYLQCEK